jgi:hypothetical protein
MAINSSPRQPDLFAPLETVSSRPLMPPEFVERIRGELHGTLARASAARTMPWSDLTQATLAELRFHSIAGWLPADEADDLRGAFKIEMERLYKVVEEQYDNDNEC